MRKSNKISVLITSLLISGTSVSATLEEVITKSRLNDQNIHMLHEDLIKSFEGYNEISASYMPQVNLQGDINVNALNDSDLRDYNSYLTSTLGLSGTYQLYDPSKSSLENLSKIESSIAYYKYISYLNTQSSTVTSLYYDVLKYRDSLEVDKETHKAVIQQHDKIYQMAEVGLRTLVDVAEVQAQLDQSEATLLISENNLESSILKLAVYTNDYTMIPEDVDFEDIKESLEEKPYPYWKEMFEANNLDLKLAKSSELIAKESIKLTKSENDIRVNLTSSIGSSYKNESYDDFEYSASLGVSFSLPVYDGGVNNSRIAQAQHDYTRSAMQSVQTYREMEPQLKILYNELRSIERSIESYKKAVESAKYSYEAIDSGYRIGTRDVLDVLNANSDYAIAKKNLYALQYNYLSKQELFKSMTIKYK